MNGLTLYKVADGYLFALRWLRDNPANVVIDNEAVAALEAKRSAPQTQEPIAESEDVSQ